jgi:hypothetical protein
VLMVAATLLHTLVVRRPRQLLPASHGWSRHIWCTRSRPPPPGWPHSRNSAPATRPSGHRESTSASPSAEWCATANRIGR